MKKGTKIVISIGCLVGFIALSHLVYYWYVGKSPITNEKATELVTKAWGSCQTIDDFCQQMSVNVVRIEGAYFVVAKYSGLHTDGDTTLISVAPLIYRGGVPTLGDRTKVNR